MTYGRCFVRSCARAILAVLGLGAAVSAAPPPGATVLATGLKNPESVCVGPKGLLYITEIGEFGKDGDGRVLVLEDGKTRVYCDGFDDPKGIVFHKDAFYLTDKTRVFKIDAAGKKSVYVPADKFPSPPLFLNDIALDAYNELLVVSDSGREGKGGAAYRIDLKTGKIDTVADATTIPGLQTPNGVVFDGESHFLLADMARGFLHRVNLVTGKAEKIAEGLEGADGLTFDNHGGLFITSWTTGKTFVIPRPGLKPMLLAEGLASAADCCLDSTGKRVVIPDMKSGSLIALPAVVPGWEVDERPLPAVWTPAFSRLKWTGWDDGSKSGKNTPLRPILLTHAGDGSGRVFVPQQQGIIHSFEGRDDAESTKIFLDISKKVRYKDSENEEGLLGLAFHPKFKQNGEFFVFYTDVKAEMSNVVSRFRVRKDDPTTADPASEEEIFRYQRPFWNHCGGTLLFGADGYLYAVHGDGGSANDPHGNGQNLKTPLGKVLRLDVDHASRGKPYAIPADNPFVGRSDAMPEIFAFGLRNPWRISVDRKTGRLWCADVGQNLYEEINLLQSGGNYGWSVREGLHPFGPKGSAQRSELIDPIWEYHHNVGLSITGGAVYRGRSIPELAGAYIYGDYVSNRAWALTYDEKQKRVVANRPLPFPGLPIMSFGEDEAGELYAMGAAPTGRGIFRLAPKAGN